MVRFYSTKRDTRTSNQPQTTPRCDVAYKHFVVLGHWLVMTRHLPDLENLHGTLTCQSVSLPSGNPSLSSFCSDHFCVGKPWPPSQRLLTVIKRFFHVLPLNSCHSRLSKLQGTTSKTLVVQQREKHFTGVVVR